MRPERGKPDSKMVTCSALKPWTSQTSNIVFKNAMGPEFKSTQERYELRCPKSNLNLRIISELSRMQRLCVQLLCLVRYVLSVLDTVHLKRHLRKFSATHKHRGGGQRRRKEWTRVQVGSNNWRQKSVKRCICIQAFAYSNAFQLHPRHCITSLTISASDLLIYLLSCFSGFLSTVRLFLPVGYSLQD